jgi:excisionase family DNA binding protein
MTTPLLTVDQVAEHLNLPEHTVRKLIRLGELPAINVACGKNPLYRVAREGLDQFLASRAVTT